MFCVDTLSFFRNLRHASKAVGRGANLIAMRTATNLLGRRSSPLMERLQHNMWVAASRTAVLSIVTGGGRWVEITIAAAGPLYPHLLLPAEKTFWRFVQSGETARC
jgi:hypothetical protein